MKINTRLFILVITTTVINCSSCGVVVSSPQEPIPPMTGELMIGTRIYEMSALFYINDGLSEQKMEHDSRSIDIYVRYYSSPLRILKPKPESLWQYAEIKTDPEVFVCTIRGKDGRYVHIERKDELESFSRGDNTIQATVPAEMLLLLVDANGLRQTIYLKGEDQSLYGLNDMDYYLPILSELKANMDNLRSVDDFWQW